MAEKGGQRARRSPARRARQARRRADHAREPPPLGNADHLLSNAATSAEVRRVLRSRGVPAVAVLLAFTRLHPWARIVANGAIWAILALVEQGPRGLSPTHLRLALPTPTGPATGWVRASPGFAPSPPPARRSHRRGIKGRRGRPYWSGVVSGASTIGIVAVCNRWARRRSAWLCRRSAAVTERSPRQVRPLLLRLAANMREQAREHGTSPSPTRRNRSATLRGNAQLRSALKSLA